MSHSNEYAYCDRLRCDTVQSGRRGPTFRSNILPLFSHFIAGGYENTTTHCELCSSGSVVWVSRPENLHSISGGDGDLCLRHFLQTDFRGPYSVLSSGYRSLHPEARCDRDVKLDLSPSTAGS